MSFLEKSVPKRSTDELFRKKCVPHPLGVAYAGKARSQKIRLLNGSPALIKLPGFFLKQVSMHIPPEVWGPFFWHTIHIVALGYPENPNYTDKKAAKEFFESLQVLIPCAICKNHYASHLAKLPVGPSLDDRKDLFRWTVNLHNEVNESLGKRKYTETEVIYYYTRLGARGMSPVIKAEDFVEGDRQAMWKGVALGVGLTAALGGILYFHLRK